jgi:hypothetical protein
VNRHTWRCMPGDGYIKDTLKLAGLDTCNGAGVPGKNPNDDEMIQESTKLDKNQHWMYRQVVGRNQFGIEERADCQYAQKMLAHDLSNPTQSSLTRMKRLLRYMKETDDLPRRYA